MGTSGVGTAFVGGLGYVGVGSGHSRAVSGFGISAFSLVFFRCNLFGLYVSPFGVSTMYDRSSS